MSRPPIDGDTHDYFLRLADIVPGDALRPGAARRSSPSAMTSCPITQQTENIIALKISGIPDKNYEAKQLLDIPVLCGWDLMSFLAYQMGADGVISGSATLVPEHEVRLYNLVNGGAMGRGARPLLWKARAHLELLHLRPTRLLGVQVHPQIHGNHSKTQPSVHPTRMPERPAPPRCTRS